MNEQRSAAEKSTVLGTRPTASLAGKPAFKTVAGATQCREVSPATERGPDVSRERSNVGARRTINRHVDIDGAEGSTDGVGFEP